MVLGKQLDEGTFDERGDKAGQTSPVDGVTQCFRLKLGDAATNPDHLACRELIGYGHDHIVRRSTHRLRKGQQLLECRCPDHGRTHRLQHL